MELPEKYYLNPKTKEVSPYHSPLLNLGGDDLVDWLWFCHKNFPYSVVVVSHNVDYREIKEWVSVNTIGAWVDVSRLMRYFSLRFNNPDDAALCKLFWS